MSNERPTYANIVTLGNLLTIVAMLGSLLVAWGSLSGRLAAIDLKVDTMWAAFSRQLSEK